MYFHLTGRLELFKTLKYLNRLAVKLHGLYSGFVFLLCESLSLKSHCTVMKMKEIKLLISFVMPGVCIEINWCDLDTICFLPKHICMWRGQFLFFIYLDTHTYIPIEFNCIL